MIGDSTPENNSSKRKKPASDAEKIAMELSKIYFSFEINCNQRDDHLAVMLGVVQRTHSCQRISKTAKRNSCLCNDAELVFESNLPDRNFLSRFSVKCSSCNDKMLRSPLYLYCAYCGDVLQGTIASPGGKTSDHLITIRHVLKRSLVLINSIEYGISDQQDLLKAQIYLQKLESFSEKIRYPVKAPIDKSHFEEAIRHLNRLLCRRSTKLDVGREVRHNCSI